MKISVIANSAGEIIGASFDLPGAAQLPGHAGADKINARDGQQVHEVTLPDELANEILSGNAGRALSNCKLEIKSGKATLITKPSKK